MGLRSNDYGDIGSYPLVLFSRHPFVFQGYICGRCSAGKNSISILSLPHKMSAFILALIISPIINN